MTIDTAKLPRETKEIFDTLRKGNFIVEDHPDSHQRRLYVVCDTNQSTLFALYEALGYELVGGEGYFIFYTPEMGEAAKEHRVEQILMLLDIIDLFYGAFPSFDIGWKGTPSDLEMALKNDTVRLERLEHMRGTKGKTVYEKCESAFDSLSKFGCIVSQEDKLGSYQVTSAFNYVRDFFDSVKRINSNNSNGEEK